MRLDLLPRSPADACLAQDDGQQPWADVTAMGIGDSQDTVAAGHELVASARERTVEAKLAEGDDEDAAFDRAPGRHVSSLGEP